MIASPLPCQGWAWPKDPRVHGGLVDEVIRERRLRLEWQATLIRAQRELIRRRLRRLRDPARRG